MPDSPTKPLVDDQYWFDYSKKIVDQSADSLDQAAAKIQTLVIWLWGIYTGFAAIGFTLANKTLPWYSTLLIASTSVLLIAVYWSTVWVQLPVSLSMDPRSPTEIRRVYVALIKIKRARLKLTQFLSGISAAMVAVSLIIASMSRGAVQDEDDFSASVTTVKNEHILALTAKNKSADKVIVSIDPLDLHSGTSQQTAILLPTKGDGLIEASIPLTIVGATNFNVSLEWTNQNGRLIKVSRRIEEKK